MNREPNIPVTKIISAACRNFMAFEGLHNFEFDEAISTIVGKNSGGKTSLVVLIKQALDTDIGREWPGKWLVESHDYTESLIELKFVAGGKIHYLRRVISGNTTRDLHLYIGEGDKAEFLRDSEGFAYLKKLKPVTLFDTFWRPYKDYTKFNPYNKKLHFSEIDDSLSYIRPSAEYIDALNLLLLAAGSKISKLSVRGDSYAIENRNGTIVPLSSLALGDSSIVLTLAKFLMHAMAIDEEDNSRVILIDEMETGLSRSGVQVLFDGIRILANRYKCQFILTSRFSNGRINPITIKQPRVPKVYRTHRHLVVSNPPFSSFGKLGAWLSKL